MTQSLQARGDNSGNLGRKLLGYDNLQKSGEISGAFSWLGIADLGDYLSQISIKRYRAIQM